MNAVQIPRAGAEPFDLVELTTDVDEYPAGSRGTVVLHGPAKALVDFTWINGDRPAPDGNGVRVVPRDAVRVIAVRTFDEAIHAQAKGSPQRPTWMSGRASDPAMRSTKPAREAKTIATRDGVSLTAGTSSRGSSAA